jgi:hypothetical protein
MIPASYPLVGPSLHLRDASGYEPTLSPSIEFAGTLISQLLRHLASCDDGGGSIDGIQTYWRSLRRTNGRLPTAENSELFLGGGIKPNRISGEIKGVSVSNILLYDYTLTISCVIQAARASGGLGEVGNSSQWSRPSVNFDNSLEIQTFWAL